MPKRSVIVVGGGWAGLAAAVQCCELGLAVTLLETAPQLGGRARSLADGGLDNGQHILIGAYQETLRLMQRVGVSEAQAFLRQPLVLHYSDGPRLQLPAGWSPSLALLAGLLWAQHWPWRTRISLLRTALSWRLRGFQCPSDWTVQQLCQGMDSLAWSEFVAPLCVAALNTPADRASAQVFLRVLRDALLTVRGGSDLLLPKVSLADLLPNPATRWLQVQGAQLHTRTRVLALSRHAADKAWVAETSQGPFEADGLILACSSSEAAALLHTLCPQWGEECAALSFEPIVTVYLERPGAQLPAPMLALHEGPDAPAQFLFDLGQIGHKPGLFSAVVSGASGWMEDGLNHCAQAVVLQLHRQLGWPLDVRVVQSICEKRATFACTPQLQRPSGQPGPKGLAVAGDYIQGPYPATLEGAVRSGLSAARHLHAELST
ncbi:hydroxysqualene dehydroxylase HpnE [Roseateles sp. BYS180W]|uniref:Hydroxysqualene dehydroxylase HpnE n=1 Tax=Roseateles rivi TaxID=3299028 RepID=A0ABW7FVX0_9BURK